MVMSTRPEGCWPSPFALGVVALSVVPNMATGIQEGDLGEEAVIDAGAARAGVLRCLEEGIVARI